MLFDVQVREAGGRQVVAVVGDIDLATFPRLCASLDLLTGADPVVDLSAVTWFDPVCVGAVVAADQRARRRGGHLVVVSGPPVAKMLTETRLDQVLDVVEQLPPAP